MFRPLWVPCSKSLSVKDPSNNFAVTICRGRSMTNNKRAMIYLHKYNNFKKCPQMRRDVRIIWHFLEVSRKIVATDLEENFMTRGWAQNVQSQICVPKINFQQQDLFYPVHEPNQKNYELNKAICIGMRMSSRMFGMYWHFIYRDFIPKTFCTCTESASKQDTYCNVVYLDLVSFSIFE